MLRPLIKLEGEGGGEEVILSMTICHPNLYPVIFMIEKKTNNLFCDLF